VGVRWPRASGGGVEGSPTSRGAWSERPGAGGAPGGGGGAEGEISRWGGGGEVEGEGHVRGRAGEKEG